MVGEQHRGQYYAILEVVEYGLFRGVFQLIRLVPGIVPLAAYFLCSGLWDLPTEKKKTLSLVPKLLHHR